MKTEADVRDYMSSLREEFPELIIHDKKPWWLDTVFALPVIRNLEWETATQTIGMHIYLSTRWKEFSSAAKLSTLRHERKHLLWFDLYGTVLASFLYLFIFFPIGLAWYRARFERDGYAESLKARVEYYGPSAKLMEQGLETYLENFCGPRYLYMWPFEKTIRQWFAEDWDKALRSVQ